MIHILRALTYIYRAFQISKCRKSNLLLAFWNIRCIFVGNCDFHKIYTCLWCDAFTGYWYLYSTMDTGTSLSHWSWSWLCDVHIQRCDAIGRSEYTDQSSNDSNRSNYKDAKFSKIIIIKISQFIFIFAIFSSPPQENHKNCLDCDDNDCNLLACINDKSTNFTFGGSTIDYIHSCLLSSINFMDDCGQSHGSRWIVCKIVKYPHICARK